MYCLGVTRAGRRPGVHRLPTVARALHNVAPTHLLSVSADNASAIDHGDSSLFHTTIMSAPTISAAQSVGEYLQSPDDLAKVAAFRKKLEKEKASIDARLRSGVKEQLDATRDGLRKLFGTRNNVQTIKDEMETVDRMCSDPKYVVSTFDQISRVRLVHVRLGTTCSALAPHLGLHGPPKLRADRGDGQQSP